MTAPSPRKSETVKGQSTLIKAAEHSVSKEIVGRCRRGNQLYSTMMQRTSPLPTLQAATYRSLVSEAALNSCSKVSARQEGVNHSRLMSQKWRHQGPQAQPWPNASLCEASPSCSKGQSGPSELTAKVQPPGEKGQRELERPVVFPP